MFMAGIDRKMFVGKMVLCSSLSTALEGLPPSEENSGKQGDDMRAKRTACFSACSFLLCPSFCGKPHAEHRRHRNQLSCAHRRLDGHGGKGRGCKESLQEKVRWRGLASLPDTLMHPHCKLSQQHQGPLNGQPPL